MTARQQTSVAVGLWKTLRTKAGASIRLPLNRASPGEPWRTGLSPLRLCRRACCRIRIAPCYSTVHAEETITSLSSWKNIAEKEPAGFRLPPDFTVLREIKYRNATLTLLPVISRALSCFVTARYATSIAQCRRLIVDLDLEPDQMTLGARNTN